MYAVVGCSDCEALWVVEGRPDTTGCPRCGTRRRFDRLKQFVTADTEEQARTARAAMLAERADSDLDATAFAEMAHRAEDAGLDPAEYLAEMGVDPAEVTADDREQGSMSRAETVRAALREMDAPEESAVVEYATARGVPAEAATDLLERLVQSGEATEDGGCYRLL